MTMMKLLLVPYLLAGSLPIVATYTIKDCGPSKPAIEYAITLAQTSMIQPLYDVQRGILSDHGYSAIFKSNIFSPFLRGLMADILHLSTVHAAGRDQQPTFICVKPEHPSNPLAHCIESGVTSFWLKDTATVFLCPRFTDLAVQPALSPGGPKDIYCPLVQNNAFVGKSDPLVKYQNYDLVYQLVHLYLQGAGLTGETDPKEVTDWNACVGLGWTPFEGSPSVKNPFNLVYYVAFVNQECTQMPNPFKPPFSGREDGTRLLTVGNVTGGLSTDSTDSRV